MQLSHSSTAGAAARCSRSPQLQVRAQAPLSGSTGGASSNSKATAYVPPLSIDRPAGGGSRSFDLPRSSDLLLFTSRADGLLLRPSGGAARGAVFATGSEGGAGSIDRPGGRGGRGDMPSGWDTPSTPQDPATARPGGRGGRDAGLSGGSGGSSGPVSIERPGGRGGRDAGLSSMDQGPSSTPSIDRPGGRGGRDGPSGGGGGSGGNGGGDGGSSGSSGGGEEGGFNAGKAVGGAALYAGVIAAVWFGHKALYPEKQQAAVKPCCAGKKAKK